MSFTVTIQPSGRQLHVGRDEPILAAAIREGLGLPYGCRDGACGSCKSRLVEGRVIHGAHQAKALSPAEEAAGLILPCCAAPQTDCTIEARNVGSPGDFPVLRMPGRVLSLDRAAPDVMVIRVQLPAQQNLQWRAGQYVDLLLQSGARRSYSIANSPQLRGDPPAIELHVRHMPGGEFTDRLFAAMKVKEILRLEGPYGSFWLRDDTPKPIVLLASGTGFAPIKAVIEQMQLQGNTRPTRLYWGCRAKVDLYMDAWARAAEARMPNLRYIPVLSEPRDDDAWRGRLGLVHLAVLTDLPDLSGHQVYACGAPVMVHAAKRDFTTLGRLPEDEFHADAFTSAADKL